MVINAAFAVFVAGVLGLAALFRAPGNPGGVVLVILAGLGSWAILALCCAVWARRNDWVVKGGLIIGLALKTWLIICAFGNAAQFKTKFHKVDLPFPWFEMISWLFLLSLLIPPAISGALGNRLRLVFSKSGS